jgi:Arc/MetJ-type ribon-helix-helix transcriptional regulator
MLPIAAVQPRGDPVRLDQVRGQLARDLLARLGTADEDPALGDALDRYELALFQTEPLRSEQLREALAALLGGADGAWAAAARTALLIGESGQERAQLLERMRTSTAGGSSADISEAVRKALVETLMHGDRAALISSLDEALLGIRPRPSGYFAAKATAASAAGPRTVAAS